MSKETRVIEAESLEKAREQAKLAIPAGFLVRSEEVVSDGKPGKVKATAETSEAALAKARADVSADAEVVEEKVLVANEQAVVAFPTVEGQDPETVARSLAQQRLGADAQIRDLRLVAAGSKGFMGVGKKPHQYEVEIFRQAVVEVTYKPKAVLRISMDDDITDKDIREWEQGRNIDRLLQTLEYRDTKVRESAAFALSQTVGRQDVKAVEPLMGLLKSGGFSVITSALEALGKIGDARAIEAIAQWASSSNPDIRYWAVWALARMDDERVIEWLQKAADDEVAEVRKVAAQALELKTTPEAERVTLYAFLIEGPQGAPPGLGNMFVMPASLPEIENKIREQAQCQNANVVIVQPADWNPPRLSSVTQQALSVVFPRIIMAVQQGMVRLGLPAMGPDRLVNEGILMINPVSGKVYVIYKVQGAPAGGQGTIPGVRVFEEEIGDLVFSPDGSKLAVTPFNQSIELRQPADWGLVQVIQAQTSQRLDTLDFSPDGKLLASTAWDKLLLFKADDGSLLRTMEHPDGIRSLAFSPDGTILAAGGHDNVIRLWQVQDGVLTKTLKGHDKSVISVAFTPDGNTLVSGGADGKVILWQVSDGAIIRTLQAATSTFVAISPDGKTLAASAGHSVRLWQMSDGTAIETLGGYSGPVMCLAFTPDGEKLIAGSADCTIRVFQASDWTLLETLEGHTGWVRDVAVSPDGRTLVSAAFDSTVRVWDL